MALYLNIMYIFLYQSPALSRLVQNIKGKTSRKMLMEYQSLSSEFWGHHIELVDIL